MGLASCRFLLASVGPRSAWLATAAAMALSCSEAAAPDEVSDENTQNWPTNGWETRTPDEMGMDADVLEEAFDYAFQDGKNTQGVVIVKNGVIVGERYAQGRDQDSFGASWSAAKSFASALIGVAMDQGLIADVEQPMKDFFPEWLESPKGDIPLRSVLQMQSGLDFLEDYSPLKFAESDVIGMGLTDDALKYVLNNLPVKYAPDEHYYYSSGDTMLLGGVIEAVTGKNAADYGEEVLFGPIGMGPVDWWSDGAGHTLTFCCLDTPSREFAKFGLLFARGGEWDGEQIVSSEWVDESTSKRASDYPGYAYQWWTVDVNPESKLPRDYYKASGLNEQRIYVVPSLDLVVVRHGIYDKPPGEPVAPDGYLTKFMPDGMGAYGTDNAGLWLDDYFMAPIINSIRGVEKMDLPSLVPENVTPGACRERARNLGSYCEDIHGCACDNCTTQFMVCDQDDGCRGILACALESGCRGFACLTPCQEAIDAAGGVQADGVLKALEVSDCVEATGCATACD